MLNTELQELAVSLGFRLEESKVYIYTEGHLEYSISNHTISILDKTNMDIETYPSTKENILEIMNVSETIEEIAPLDLSIPSRTEEDNLVSSDVKNRALAKMGDEFMSQPIGVTDFVTLNATRTQNNYTIEFGSLRMFFRSDRKLFLFHGKTTLKAIKNPTRKQVDEVYHFFTGGHLDFSPKQKVYNWENCFNVEVGYFIDDFSDLYPIKDIKVDRCNRNVYPTKKDAESALAYCQLLHIVNKINEDYPKIGKD